MNLEKYLIKKLSKIDFLKEYDLKTKISIPKNKEQGDLSLPLFEFIKKLSKKPNEIFELLKNELNKEKGEILFEIKLIGPYVNFYFDWKNISKKLLFNINDLSFFKIDKKIDIKKILIEWPSPNSNKPLHIGHLRNIIIGKTICNFLENQGHKIKKINLNNDRGIAICKSMLMYKLFGENKTPTELNIKEDFFVGKFYLMFEEKSNNEKNNTYEEQAKKMLLKWENGDKETVELWEKMNFWTYLGHKKSYDLLKLEHDKQYYESDIYNLGKKIIMENKNNIFEKDEKENHIINLEKEGFDKKVVLRNDGTCIYITQDIALAYKKVEDFGNMDKYVFIVGNEQEYHFKVLFKILEKLKFGDMEKFNHFSYGMISLKEGKMSSRKGNVIYLDELYENVRKRAESNLLEKNKDIEIDELKEKSKVIALSSIKFSILKFSPKDEIIFDIEKSLSFIGETGPYVLYTYARINSIIKKSKFNEKLDFNIDKLNFEEIQILSHLNKFNDICFDITEKYKSNLMCGYLIKLSQLVNEYYQNNKILESDNENWKISFLKSINLILKNGLKLLDIDCLEKM